MFSPGVKRLEREADHSHLSIAEVKNAWSYTSTLQQILTPSCFIKQWIVFHDVVLS
jgi:hypothetical protein